MALGIGLDDTRKMTVQLVQAMGAMGIPLDLFARALQAELDVKPSRESSVINVSFTSADPKFSAAQRIGQVTSCARQRCCDRIRKHKQLNRSLVDIEDRFHLGAIAGDLPEPDLVHLIGGHRQRRVLLDEAAVEQVAATPIIPALMSRLLTPKLLLRGFELSLLASTAPWFWAAEGPMVSPSAM